MKEYFEVGQIVNTNGLKGFVKINPFTDNIKEFETFDSIYVQEKDNLVEYKIEAVRYVKQMVLIKLKGIDNIDMAEALRNLYVKVKRDSLPKLQKNSYYIADLLECDVYTVDGDVLGKMDDVFKTGSNDVYVVKSTEGKQILLPAIKDVIQNIDINNKKIIVKLMEGLL